MKRNLKLFLALGLCVAIFLPNMVTAADYKWPANINVGTSGAGSAHQIITQAWGSLLESKTGSKFRVVPDPDPPRMIKAMQGKLDFLFMDLGELAFYYKGEAPWLLCPR